MVDLSDDVKSDAERAPGAASGLRELIERIFLLGVGAAALSKDRVQDVVEELVRRGHLTSDEGRDMVDKFVTRGRDEARSALKKADSSLRDACRDMGLVGKREWEDLDFRLRQIEHRLQLLEAAADAGNSTVQDVPLS
jgi:polyhydroxyalkanoate synthesis regulator phasin